MWRMKFGLLLFLWVTYIHSSKMYHLILHNNNAFILHQPLKLSLFFSLHTNWACLSSDVCITTSFSRAGYETMNEGIKWITDNQLNSTQPKCRERERDRKWEHMEINVWESSWRTAAEQNNESGLRRRHRLRPLRFCSPCLSFSLMISFVSSH